MIITIVPAPEPPSRTAPKVCSVSPVVVVLSVTAVVIVVSAAVDVVADEEEEEEDEDEVDEAGAVEPVGEEEDEVGPGFSHSVIDG